MSSLWAHIHADKLGSEAATIVDSINKELNDLIRTKGFLDVVQYADVKQGKVIYTVDNISKGDHDFQQLRSAVNRLVLQRDDFSIKYPVRYLLFCLDLQNIQDTILRMDVCRKMAAKYRIEGNEVLSLLHFLHFRVGIIQYFDVDGLRQLVVKEPQILFSKVTRLLVKTFLSSGSLTTSEAENFQKKGILEASVFESVLSSKDNITPKEFLGFLLHLRMVVPFIDKNGKEKYFIPCVLNHAPESPPDEMKTDISPLSITFECGHCPKGLFAMLVTQGSSVI